MQRLVHVEFDTDEESVEKEYFDLPGLNQLLKDGWTVKQIIPDDDDGGAFVLLER